LDTFDAVFPRKRADEEASAANHMKTYDASAYDHLVAALDRLDPRQRMAFTLFAIEGRPLREVAEIMESTIGTARMRSWRARRTLYKRAKNDPLLSEFLSGHSEQEEELVR